MKKISIKFLKLFYESGLCADEYANSLEPYVTMLKIDYVRIIYS